MTLPVVANELFLITLLWWVMRDSNSRHLPCKGSALPTELITQLFSPDHNSPKLVKFNPFFKKGNLQPNSNWAMSVSPIRLLIQILIPSTYVLRLWNYIGRIPFYCFRLLNQGCFKHFIDV